MNLTNFHSHCLYCDGRASVEDFVKTAIADGFTAYGVSSHAPLPFETRWTLKKEKVPAYLEEIGRLKEKYAERIELYAGMEIDYLNEEQNPANSFFQQLALDYRIGSIHLIYTPEGEIVDTDTNPEHFKQILEVHFQGDLRAMITRYLEASMRMVEKGGFDIIGHADKISYNAGLCDSSLSDQEWYKQKLMDYFALIAEKGMVMEINTKAFLKKGCFFPNKKYFRLLKDLRIPVQVNSDAHSPELIGAGRKEALDLLKENGIQTVRVLKEGLWKDEII